MIEVEIKGLDILEQQLISLGNDIGPKALRSAAMAAMEPVKKDMLANVPIFEGESRKVKNKKDQTVTLYPGFMKSRIKKRSRLNRKGRAGRHFKNQDTTVVVRTGVFRVPYVVQQEFGTTRHSGKPFIRPALDKNIHVVTNLFKKKLQQRIKFWLRKRQRESKR
ncbi:HK97-gp10 family putative phage morphogenesis protein [Marinibactrum halimedae]|uniref:HK97 gp10 family phage protein n=1 Tax=Marinibactrum halimedae TaxID=1444977 RepID=A0AA37WNN2_9GAMM|nr:HK97-gp10 family putative phage morphogenesis protein [Marinibactrum halimedae]MCD9458889.1 hypothetical protein [Marinibactrum halimedae]GLS27738.1 hypothetical protein GCM10007877_34570 [Marinibactrum halimedae]